MSWQEVPVVTPGTGDISMIGLTGQVGSVIGVTGTTSVIGVTGSGGGQAWIEQSVASQGSWTEVTYP